MAGHRGFGYTRGRSTKTMNVVYEQPAKFNRYVDESIPLTWGYRWRTLKLVIPAIAFLYLTTAELLAFRLWQDDGLSPGELPFVLLAPFSIVPLLLLLVEGAIRTNHRSKRVLKLKDRWVSLSPSRVSRIRWKHIRACRFEPIQNQPGLTKFTVLFGPAKQGGWRRRWSMVLASPEQKDDLLAQVESRRDSKDHNYEVRVLTRPQPAPQPDCARGSMTVGMAVYLLGIFLFVHGAPALAYGALGVKDPPRAGQPLDNPTSQPKERFPTWLITPSSNAAELRRFFLVVGGTLTACSVASLVGGSLLMNRSRKRMWAAIEAEVLSSK